MGLTPTWPGGEPRGRGNEEARQVLQRRASARMGIGCTVVAAWWREKWRSSQRTRNCPRVVMEVPQRLLATTSAPSWSRKLLLLPLLLFLLPAKALWDLEVEERPPTHEEECHFYACTQVYLVGRRPRFRLPTTPCTSAKPRFPSQHLIGKEQL